VSETAVWIAPDGSSTTLHNGSNPYGGTYFVSWSVSGRFSPPVRFQEDGVPDQDGLRLRAVFHGANEITLPIWVQGSSDADLRTKIRALVSSMNPKRGDGKLRITSPLGDQREVVCRVASGFDGAERIGDTTGAVAQMFPLTFKAHDPYWQDVADIVAGPWTVGTSPGSFFPFFPIRLSSSEVFAQVTIDNTGDENSWPIWTITGPGDNFKLKNLTTNKTLDIGAYFIIAGEVITIDTRPSGLSRRTITSNVAGNLYTRLTVTSAMWPLIPGSNQISIEMGTASAGVTSVQMARRQKYLAA
jgi:Phage tail protein